MATFTKQSKNTASYTNQNKAGVSLTWDETAPKTWAEAGSATWGNPYFWSKQTKNTASFSNQTKNQ